MSTDATGRMAGRGYYDAHALAQSSAGGLGVPLLERAVDAVALPDGPGQPLVTADLGAAGGRNELQPMAVTVERLRNRRGHEGARPAVGGRLACVSGAPRDGASFGWPARGGWRRRAGRRQQRRRGVNECPGWRVPWCGGGRSHHDGRISDTNDTDVESHAGRVPRAVDGTATAAGITLVESTLAALPDQYLPGYRATGDAAVFADAVAGFVRAFTEPSLIETLDRAPADRAAIADAVYRDVRDHVASDPPAFETTWHVALLRIARTPR